MADKTCKYFAPDKATAEQYHLAAHPRWRFDQLLPNVSCTCAGMGGGDVPVTCIHAADQPACPCYEAEPKRILEVWRHPRNPLAYGEGDYEFFVTTEDRTGSGVRTLTATKFTTDDPAGKSVGNATIVETMTSTDHGEELDAQFATWAAEWRAGTDDNWERMERLEAARHLSYFGHVYALAADA